MQRTPASRGTCYWLLACWRAQASLALLASRAPRGRRNMKANPPRAHKNAGAPSTEMISRLRALRMPPCLSGAALCQAGPWLCRVLSGLSGFIRFYPVLSGRFYPVLSGFGGFYRALMGFRGLSWVWVGFSASLLVDVGPLVCDAGTRRTGVFRRLPCLPSGSVGCGCGRSGTRDQWRGSARSARRTARRLAW